MVGLYPNSGFVWELLGQSLQMQGKDSLHAFQKTAELLPNDAGANYNLGAILKSIGRLHEAAASYRNALKANPDFADAHINLGNVLGDIGQIDDALESYRSALNIKPNSAEAHLNMGVALSDIGQYNNALASYRRAIQLKPDYAIAYNNLGDVLKNLGQMNGAMSSYHRALQIKPDYNEARSNLLFCLNYIDHAASDFLAEASNYGRIIAKKVPTKFSTWKCENFPKRLRIGFVSGDFRTHSVGHFIEGLVSHIDPARIELIAYPTHRKEDELTARIRPHFSAWKPLVGKSDEAAAKLIHADGVHILLDISGHSAHNRLPVFAWKPAPVQVTWLGLPVTTGVSEIDYILGDALAIPSDHESHFSEAVWRMPDSYLCFSSPSHLVNVAPLPAFSAGYVTFGSFNNLCKMNDTVVELWARILMAVPNSRLYLKSHQLKDEGIREEIKQRFTARGIAPERLLLQEKLVSISNHLAEYNNIDVALDTFPYPGITTSVEALWMGVPVLTLLGDRFLSLSAKSIAHHAGLADWVATDQEDYVAKAVAITSDLDRLAALRVGLRQRVLASPVFDASRFARNFEDNLWAIWQAEYEKSHEM